MVREVDGRGAGAAALEGRRSRERHEVGRDMEKNCSDWE